MWIFVVYFGIVCIDGVYVRIVVADLRFSYAFVVVVIVVFGVCIFVGADGVSVIGWETIVGF